MSVYHVEQITPSKWGNGDRWRVKIDGEWYDGYFQATEADLPQCPVDVELEWRQSTKTGKDYISALGNLRAAPRGAQRSNGPRPATTPPAPGPRAAGPAPAAGGGREYDPSRDQWILVSAIVGHWIDAHPAMTLDQLGELASTAAAAALKVRRHLAGAPAVEAAKAAVASRPAAKPAPELGDPDDPRNTGADFDDDIPF